MMCPACCGESTALVPARFLPSKRTVLRCNTCGLDFMPGADDTDYWSASGQKSVYEAPGVRVERNRFFRKLLALIDRIGTGRGRLLDIGAGRGEFALEAAAAGWRVSVVEPSAEATAGLAENGIEVFNCAFERFAAHRPYDCVTMLDVIEHTRNPRAFIGRAVDCLKPGGLMLLLTPDGGCGLRRAARVFGGLSSALAGFLKYLYYPPHISYLSGRTLRRYASECGMRPAMVTRSATPRRFLLAKLANHYRGHTGNAAFTAAVSALYPLVSLAAANKLIFAARKA